MKAKLKEFFFIGRLSDWFFNNLFNLKDGWWFFVCGL